MGYRNGVQDIVYTLLFAGLDPESTDEQMQRKLEDADRKMKSFRKQNFAHYSNAMNQVMGELRHLNATAPCEKCGGTGRAVKLADGSGKCRTCRGTGWELLM